MKRYWFEFDFEEGLIFPPGTVMGCGVTAHDLDDARRILKERVFSKSFPQLKKVVENVDVSTLDPMHVLPNIGVVTERGVWFPLGYNR